MSDLTSNPSAALVRQAIASTGANISIPTSVATQIANEIDRLTPPQCRAGQGAGDASEGYRSKVYNYADRFRRPRRPEGVRDMSIKCWKHGEVTEACATCDCENSKATVSRRSSTHTLDDLRRAAEAVPLKFSENHSTAVYERARAAFWQMYAEWQGQWIELYKRGGSFAVYRLILDELAQARAIAEQVRERT